LPCRWPSGRRYEAQTKVPLQFWGSFVVASAERKPGGTLETPIQGDAPIWRVARGLKNAPDRRISIGFMTVRGPQAHRDRAEAPTPRFRFAVRRPFFPNQATSAENNRTAIANSQSP